MICSVPACSRPSKKRGLCNAHYLRQWRHGSPTHGRAMTGEPLAWLSTSLLIETDDCVTWPFSRSTAGYGDLRVNGEHVLAHRWVCEKVHGPAPTLLHEAAHSCGKGHEACVNKRHLSWKTHKDNHDDRHAHGTDGFSVWRRWRAEGVR